MLEEVDVSPLMLSQEENVTPENPSIDVSPNDEYDSHAIVNLKRNKFTSLNVH